MLRSSSYVYFFRIRLLHRFVPENLGTESDTEISFRGYNFTSRRLEKWEVPKPNHESELLFSAASSERGISLGAKKVSQIPRLAYIGVMPDACLDSGASLDELERVLESLTSRC